MKSFLLAWALVCGGVAPAGAQLLSPGKLASPHAELEGIRNCTRCHELGRRGVSRDLCLGCHSPLARRLEERRGFHSTLAEPDCASCHKDHFGVDFALVKLDTLSFDHGRTGYALEGAHGDVGCRTCHQAERVADPEVRRAMEERAALDRTWLGLPRECADCHTEVDPHGGAFGDRACTGCHSVQGWTGAEGFDHRDTRYPLTGRHAAVSCEGCHTTLARRGPDGSRGGVLLSFGGVAFGACADCHGDPHGGAMDGACSTCHATTGWLGVDRTRVASRFDHSTTGFELVGRHRQADCAACHDPVATGRIPGLALRFDPASRNHAFPTPAADDCSACHVDSHEGDFTARPDGGACTSCHGQEAWVPAAFDRARHDREAAFRLDGAHAVVPCAACHERSDGSVGFKVGVPEGCTTCHASDDPHGDQFGGRGCDTCHGIDAFRPVVVDHDTTPYPLDGAHASLDCAACHPTEPDGRGGLRVRYRPLGTECRDCHGGKP